MVRSVTPRVRAMYARLLPCSASARASSLLLDGILLLALVFGPPDGLAAEFAVVMAEEHAKQVWQLVPHRGGIDYRPGNAYLDGAGLLHDEADELFELGLLNCVQCQVPVRGLSGQ